MGLFTLPQHPLPCRLSSSYRSFAHSVPALLSFSVSLFLSLSLGLSVSQSLRSSVSISLSLSLLTLSSIVSFCLSLDLSVCLSFSLFFVCEHQRRVPIPTLSRQNSSQMFGSRGPSRLSAAGCAGHLGCQPFVARRSSLHLRVAAGHLGCQPLVARPF